MRGAVQRHEEAETVGREHGDVLPHGGCGTRVLGVAWAVFGIPHFAYHATHFGHMPLIDVLGNIFSLGASVLLGIALMLPVPRPAGAVTFPSASQQESRT